MKIYFSIVLSLLSLASAWAQVSFRAEVSDRQVDVGERFTIEFKVNRRGSNFRPPSLPGLQVLSGPNVSQSTYMDNSGMRFNLSYSYTVRAQKKGTLVIEPAYIDVDNNTYKTEPIELKVVERKAENDPYQKIRANVFVRPIVSKTSVYIGEPIYARYRLYFRESIGNPSVVEEPDFGGIYRENIEQNRIDTEQEEWQGRRFNAGDLRRIVLIPQRSGTLKPGVLKTEVPVQINTGRRDIFGRPIAQVENILLENEFPQLEVKPLPTAGKPDNFSGAVGQFELKASVSNRQLSADESLTLKIEVSGTGNLKLFELPTVKVPPAFEVFDPENEVRINVGGYGMRGKRSASYLLVPRYSGTYKIGPIEFSYFDPKTGHYRTARSEVFEIEVTGSALPPAGGSAGGAVQQQQENVELLRKDIHYIHTHAPYWHQCGDRFWNSKRFWLWMAVMALLYLGLLSVALWRYRNRGPESEQRRQKAARQAKRRLAAAKKALKKAQRETFYHELSTALWGYFSDKLNIGASQLTKELLREELQKRGVSQDLQERCFRVLEAADMARFTGIEAGQPESDYRETADLLTAIDTAL